MLRKTLVIMLLAVMDMSAAFAQTIQVEAPNLVALDEQFTVRFTVSGESGVTSFQWSPSDDFTLVFGPQKGTSTSISMINGKTTRSSTTSFTYILLPRKAGTFTLPAASAEIAGNAVHSKVKTVEVVEEPSQSSAGQSDQSASGNRQQNQPSGRQGGDRVSDSDIFIRLNLSKTSVVVGEPITATLKLYTRVQAHSYTAEKFPSFAGFWSQELEDSGIGQFQREKYNDQIYNAAVLKKYVIIPQKTGSLTIEASELQCQVDVGETYGRSAIDAFFSPYTTIRKTLRTPEIKVNVSPLPAGAPDSFKGGVGTFSMDVSLSKDNLKSNDAGSLMVTIKGTGNISLLQAPDVKFPVDFETYEVKSSENVSRSTGITSGTKTFEYPFIPRSYGEFSFDPVEYTYFDVNTRKYVTLESQPLNLIVEKGSGAPASEPSSVNLQSVDRKDVRNLGEDIRYISRKAGLSRKGSFFVWSPLFLLLSCFIIIASAAVALVLRRREKLLGDETLVKKKKATKMALRRLRTAQDYLGKNLYIAFYDELHKTLLGFASDKLGMPAVELSKDNIAARLGEGGVPDSLRDRFVGLLDACEFARYSPDAGHDAMRKHYDEAADVISSTDSMFKKKNDRKSGPAATLMALFLIIPAALNAQEAGSVQTQDFGTRDNESLWEAGVQAYADGSWEEARSCWQAIADNGMESAALYCNIADTWFQERNYARAVLNYERALKLNPSHDDARHNIKVAASFVQDKIDPVPEFFFKSWMRAACYSLSSDVWAVMGLVMLAALAAMLALFFIGSSSGIRKTGFFCAIAAFVLMLACVCFASWQKSDYEATDKAIVTASVVSAKSSPAEGTSKDLFVLHEGTKVTIMETMGEWIRINLADGRQGWLPARSVEVI
ncbi:MAG: BatD family protein [Bacteroidales bacterium]|nr:BatD family protein [Bacteroidales bacterium]